MAQGDLGSVIDSLTFESTYAIYPDLLHIDGEVYAIAYTGGDSDGWLKTFSIDSGGNISAAAIDTLEFEINKGYIPRLIHISGTLYAIVYANINADGAVSTITISNDGNIGAGLIDTLVFDVWAANGGKICHVAGDIYAIVFTGYASDGFVITVDIDSAGNIENAEIDRLEFDGVQGIYPAIVRVSTGYYAVAYQGVDGDGFIKTFTVSGLGAIGAGSIDTFEFETTEAQDLRFIHIADTIFAVAYTGSGGAGTIKTFSISATGDIGASVIDTLVFSATSANFIDFLSCGENLFVIAYQDVDGDGKLVSFTISDAGEISNAVLDTLEFETDSCMSLSLRHVTGDIFAIAFVNSSFDGYLITFDLETAVPAIAKHLPLMGIG